MKKKVTAMGGVGVRVASSGRMPTSSEQRFSIRLFHRLPLTFVMAIILFGALASSSHAQGADQQQKLERLLRRFPDADANKDGKLTIEEAKAYNATHPELRQKQRADGEDGADRGKVGRCQSARSV